MVKCHDPQQFLKQLRHDMMLISRMPVGAKRQHVAIDFGKYNGPVERAKTIQSRTIQSIDYLPTLTLKTFKHQCIYRHL